MRSLHVSLSIIASAWWTSFSKRVIFYFHPSICLLLCIYSISAAFPVRILLWVDTVGRRSRASFVLTSVEALVLLSGGAAFDRMIRVGAALFTVILTAVRCSLCLRPPLATWLMIGCQLLFHPQNYRRCTLLQSQSCFRVHPRNLLRFLGH